jgi:hypothetical protein
VIKTSYVRIARHVHTACCRRLMKKKGFHAVRLEQMETGISRLAAAGFLELHAGTPPAERNGGHEHGDPKRTRVGAARSDRSGVEWNSGDELPASTRSLAVLRRATLADLSARTALAERSRPRMAGGANYCPTRRHPR